MAGKLFRALSVGPLSVQKEFQLLPPGRQPKRKGEVAMPFIIQPLKPHIVTWPEDGRAGAAQGSYPVLQSTSQSAWPIVNVSISSSYLMLLKCSLRNVASSPLTVTSGGATALGQTGGAGAADTPSEMSQPGMDAFGSLPSLAAPEHPFLGTLTVGHISSSQLRMCPNFVQVACEKDLEAEADT